MSETLADGWYKLTWRDGTEDYEKVVNNCVDYGSGDTVNQCLAWGWKFEPAICMSVPDHAALVARIAELEAQVKQRDDDWLKMLRAIAKLEDLTALADEWIWGDPDDEVLLEEFDPWNALRIVESQLDPDALTAAYLRGVSDGKAKATRWEPIPRSLEYDLITALLQGKEIPQEYRLCRVAGEGTNGN